MEQGVLARLFKRIYEDNANGKLSDSKFQMLSDHYEQEPEELGEKLLQLNEEIKQQEEQAENIPMLFMTAAHLPFHFADYVRGIEYGFYAPSVGSDQSV